jgi:aldehyde dehydrogenase (NAD+)
MPLGEMLNFTKIRNFMQIDIIPTLQNLGIQHINLSCSTGKQWNSSNTQQRTVIVSPVDGKEIASVNFANAEDFQNTLATAEAAFKIWRTWPAPKRGEIIRQLGDALRQNKEDLGKLVSYEMGKSLQEGYGEVQEMIDICDFALGLSRQLYGLTMHSERAAHRMYEQWHPMGVVGIISAFNFPVAVWAWNASLALVCGNVCIWKPSEKTPLTAIACQHIIQKVFEANEVPEGTSCLILGDRNIGELMSHDKRIALESATGSTRMAVYWNLEETMQSLYPKMPT